MRDVTPGTRVRTTAYCSRLIRHGNDGGNGHEVKVVRNLILCSFSTPLPEEGVHVQRETKRTSCTQNGNVYEMVHGTISDLFFWLEKRNGTHYCSSHETSCSQNRNVFQSGLCSHPDLDLSFKNPQKILSFYHYLFIKI